jgi:hypothetical protein
MSPRAEAGRPINAAVAVFLEWVWNATQELSSGARSLTIASSIASPGQNGWVGCGPGPGAAPIPYTSIR